MEGFFNRQADRWRPLFAIADEIGGAWPAMVKGAAQELENRGERSYALDLLSDIRDIFDADGGPVLKSEDILNHLLRQQESPWAEWSKGNPMTPHALAKMLKPFDIESVRSRAGTPNPVSVYTRKSFEPVWERYLPSPGLNIPVPTGTSRTNPDSVLDVSDVPVDLCLPGVEVDGEGD